MRLYRPLGFLSELAFCEKSGTARGVLHCATMSELQHHNYETFQESKSWHTSLQNPVSAPRTAPV